MGRFGPVTVLGRAGAVRTDRYEEMSVFNGVFFSVTVYRKNRKTGLFFLVTVYRTTKTCWVLNIWDGDSPNRTQRNLLGWCRLFPHGSRHDTREREIREMSDKKHWQVSGFVLISGHNGYPVFNRNTGILTS